MVASALKLYEQVDDLQTVLDWLEEHEEDIRAAGGEIPPELDELMEKVEGDLKTKVERTALTIENLKANAAAAKIQADRLAKRAKSFERQAASLSDYLHHQMRRAGVDRVETPTVTVRIQRASRPSIRPVGEIPEEFQRVKVEFDGTKAYNHLKPLLGKGCDDVGEIDGLRFEYSHGIRIR